MSVDLYQASAANSLSSNLALLKDAVIPGSGHCVIRQVQSRAAALQRPILAHYTIYTPLPFA